MSLRVRTSIVEFVGSVGGDICIWKADGDWELMKTMKGHKAAVSSLAAHPSGSLALSVSRDKQMRLWDLGKGSCAYQAPLGAEGDVVGFFPSGDRYFIASSNPSAATGSKVSIHNTQVRNGFTCEHTIIPNAASACMDVCSTHTMHPQTPTTTLDPTDASSFLFRNRPESDRPGTRAWFTLVLGIARGSFW